MKKSMTLWQMLCWAYGRQLVHRYLRAPSDWLEWMYAMEFATEGDVKRPAVSRDAALVHAAVVELNQHDAVLLATMAIDGQQPAPDTRLPKPYMVDADTANRGDRIVGGRGIRHVVRTADRVVIATPIVQRVGKRRGRVIGEKLEPFDVDYCPLFWEPDLDWVQTAQAIHHAWCRSMNDLFASVQRIEFVEHEVTGLGIEVPQLLPPELFEMVGGNALAETRGVNAVGHEVEVTAEDTCVAHFGSAGYQLLRRHVRAVNKM